MVNKYITRLIPKRQARVPLNWSTLEQSISSIEQLLRFKDLEMQIKKERQAMMMAKANKALETVPCGEK